MVGMLFLFLGREFFTSEQNNQRITQPSRQSKKHMTNLEAFALLSMNQGKPKRGTSQPSFQIGDYVLFSLPEPVWNSNRYQWRIIYGKVWRRAC